MKYAVEAKQLEKKAMHLHEALGQLFEKEHDAIELIKWKEIYDDLEGTLTRRKTSPTWSSPSRSSTPVPASVWFCSGDPAGRLTFDFINAFTTRRTPSPRSCPRACCRRAAAVVWCGVLELRRGVRLGTAIAKTVARA